ncbi:glycoside hydrolase family 3 N-terminal domain-containing protein [Pedobacter sp. SYSU D00535]|uniref:glycoside hydrolase family 3 N-terminal domain-containing protein n=1 Tax=Pedobacter sp. SYSU D00535 TaxID=2810308 RepID=UPI001F608827|nr:glycoside hydrolase family 3 N-terminal domain-containing protein [Pedobacter sp. SYSU D00535]
MNFFNTNSMNRKGLLRALLLSLLVNGIVAVANAQQFLQKTPAAQAWVEQSLKKLTRRQKIAQLMVIRLSERKGKEVVFYDKEVGKYVRKYNVGSVCLFQGNSPQQATVLNRLQAAAKTPLLVCIDGETGLGMRFGDVKPFPDQLTIGAAPDAALAYQVGRAIAEQCKRAGIHVDYAPVVDINNNPNNPVINFRSFGEDKYKVASFGTQIMKGMQDGGVMACAKHFPGHGDVAVDSHLDLPVINKSLASLDSLEIYPFRELAKAGVGSMMVAHLYIPAIDTVANQATSLSRKNVTGLLREQLGYQGLTFTDALEMKGVSKFYPQGEAAVQSLIAGNDMLCLPGDIKGSIKKVRKAIRQHKLSWGDIDEKVRKVLISKFHLGAASFQPIDTIGIAADLNKDVNRLKKEIYENAITAVRLTNSSLLPLNSVKKIAFLGIGLSGENEFGKLLRENYKADCYYLDYAADAAAIDGARKSLQGKYDVLITGLHAYKKYPANNFGISATSIELLRPLAEDSNTINFVFGNPYAIKNITSAKNIIACYEDDPVMHQAALKLLQGVISAKGKLPVTVSPELPYGTGVSSARLSSVSPEAVGLNGQQLNKIDSVALDAIEKGATPGAVVLVARKGKIAFHRAYGSMDAEKKEAVTTETVYDLASVTKTSATTLSVMKLYEEGRLDLNKTLGDYLPWTKGSDKAGLTIKDILLHQAGLVSFIPFYRETLGASGKPKPGAYSSVQNSVYSVRVGENMYMPAARIDSMYQRILTSKLGPRNKYVYSDNDFIFLGEVVEQITGQGLDQYTRNTFYLPLGMTTTTFKPLEHLSLNQIAPTENEKYFRLQQIRGDVHDQGAAMFGGVAGHAGLFSNAADLAKLYVLLLNGGELNGLRLLKKETIDYFTAYHSDISRRGLGFDKPEKDNKSPETAYPCFSASPQTFGHTGFTGIGVWADPKYDLVYIFLSNRVCPDGANNQLSSMSVRGKIQELVYQSLVK